MRKMYFAPGLFALLLAVGVFAAGCDSAGTGMGSLNASSSTGDEEYSIALMAFLGHDQMEQAQRYKVSTQEQAGWKDLFVLSDGNKTVLYWGKYSTPDSAAGNLKIAKAWKTKAGHVAFGGATILALPGGDPGPADWNLKTSKGNYTVMVAIYHDVPEDRIVGRKKNAIEACRVLREKGEEAYFFHGPSQSMVCVGSFPDSAVDEVYQPNGSWAQVLRDGRIRELLNRYPKLAVNGKGRAQTAIDPATGKEVFADVPSEFIRIPGRPDLPPRAVYPKDLTGAGLPGGPNDPAVQEVVRQKREALRKARSGTATDAK